MVWLDTKPIPAFRELTDECGSQRAVDSSLPQRAEFSRQTSNPAGKVGNGFQEKGWLRGDE